VPVEEVARATRGCPSREWYPDDREVGTRMRVQVGAWEDKADVRAQRMDVDMSVTVKGGQTKELPDHIVE
jgi:hypothetical protein